MEKRGQITTFIIVGIVLVSAFILFLFVNDIISQPSGGPGTPDAVAVKRFTETCMKDILDIGADRLMTGAGYIDGESVFPDTIFKRDSYLEMPQKIPYWFYKGQDRMPTKRDMESQLEQYLDAELPACLDRFRQFDAYLNIEQSGSMDSQVYINREDITATLDMALVVKELIEQKEETLTGFTSVTSSPLGKLYQVASTIMKTENREGFLEFFTDDIIASSSDFPYEGISFSCAPMRWTKYQLQAELKDKLAPNLMMIRFDNTQAPPTGIPYFDKLYRMDILGEDFSDVSVDVIYNPEWGLSLDVYPSKGSVVYPLEVSSPDDTPVSVLISALSGVCIKIFHHKYTAEYPVLFKVGDVKTGESFFFSTPVLMKNNQPNRKGNIQDLEFQVDVEGSRRFCADTTFGTDFAIDELDNNRIIAYEGVELPKTKRKVNVYVQDQYSGEFIADAPIVYQCLKYRCDENGNTSYPLRDGLVTGAPPLLEGEFPDCIGAFFKTEKEGYHSGRVQRTVDETANGMDVIIPAFPTKRFAYFFKILLPDGTTRELKNDELVMVNIENRAMRFTQNIFYPTDLEEFSNLELLWGTYNYSVQLILFSNDKAVGGGELSWVPDPAKIETQSKIMFYPLLFDDFEGIDPTSEEWQTFLRRSRQNPPQLIGG